LPKIDGAALVKDFRPISLIHSFAKLVTKLMENRLSVHLNAMVSPNQTTFIKKDSFLTISCWSNALLGFSTNKGRLVSSSSWTFSRLLTRFHGRFSLRLRKMGFGQIWCDVVSGLLATSSTRILLNGVPGEIIAHQRGLRQGDPLSPMLFILVMDALNLLIQKASDEGLLQRLSSGALHHRLSLYADDAVVFLRHVASDINIILEILRLFGGSFGAQD
jgi:hypothetical protein